MKSSEKNASEGSEQLSVTFQVSGVKCASCVSKIENAVSSVKGVNAVAMNFADRTLLVEGGFATKMVMAEVAKVGFSLERIVDAGFVK